MHSQVAIDTSSEPMSKIEKLRYEKALLGFYVSGHPLEDYKEILPSINDPICGDLSVLHDRDQFRICGVISALTKKITKKDNRAWAFFSLETENSQYQINCFPDAFEKNYQKLQNGAIVMVTGSARSRDGGITFIASEIEPINNAISRLTRSITWLLDAETSALSRFLNIFKEFVVDNDGMTEHTFIFEFSDGHQEMAKIANSLKSSFDIGKFNEFSKSSVVKGMKFNVEPMKFSQFTRLRYG